MKIRAGFVSNSSSSSFCIVGVVVDIENFVGFNDISSLVDSLYDNQNLQVQEGISDYYDQYIIGKDIGFLKEDQTIRDFKKEIFEELKKVGYIGTVEKLCIHIDGGYQG